MSIHDEIRAGLDRGDLFVEYLPTVRLADARCVGGEALVRWRRGGDILPVSAFLPRIESSPCTLNRSPAALCAPSTLVLRNVMRG